MKKGGTRLSLKASSYKRMSSFLSASMTVEACFVLPFFLFAFLNIISIIDIYRIQGNMSAAMHDTEKTMAVYAYEYMVVTQDLMDADYGKGQSIALTYTYAASNVKNKVGGIYPDNTVWLRSEILESDDCIDLIAEYTIKPPIGIMGYRNQYMYNRLRTRAWTGYDNAKNSLLDSGDEIVYVAETGSVYHRSRGCTYLKLSISTLPKSAVKEERSADGSIYRSCEECGSKAGETVYITNYGKRYHSFLRCSKLKRIISAVPISQVGGKGPCSKCGA
jgi:hypothetical protein